MEQALYLAHYGVKGMKWGVRKAEKRALKQERKAAKREYNQVAKGKKSSADSSVSTQSLRRGRIGSYAKAIVLGKESISGLMGSGSCAVLAANASVLAAGTAMSAGALGAAYTAAAIGYGAYSGITGVAAVKSAKRAKNLNREIDLRTIRSKESSPAQRMKAQRRAKKRAMKDYKKNGGRESYNSVKRVAKATGQDVDWDIDERGRVESIRTASRDRY